MKLTKLIALSFVTCSGVLALSPIVQAAEDISLTSEGRIGFVNIIDPEKPVDPVGPVDPVDPSKPLKPVEPGKPGTGGKLSIDYVSTIKFGIDNQTSGKNTEYFAKLDRFKDEEDKEFERPNFIQVTDNRGTNAGWKLTVKQVNQFTNTTGDMLTGAQLGMKNLSMVTADGGIIPAFVKEKIELVPNESSEIVQAGENTGTGTWAALFGKNNEEAATSISLFVPGNTKKIAGNYTTSLKWDLTDAPV